MIGGHGSADRRLAQECGKARIAHVPCGKQSLDDIGPVETLERHHVADGRKRHQIEQRQKVEGCRARVAPEAEHAQCIDEYQIDDARGAEMPLPRQIVLPVRIHQGVTRRQH